MSMWRERGFSPKVDCHLQQIDSILTSDGFHVFGEFIDGNRPFVGYDKINNRLSLKLFLFEPNKIEPTPKHRSHSIIKN